MQVYIRLIVNLSMSITTVGVSQAVTERICGSIKLLGSGRDLSVDARLDAWSGP